MGNKASTAAAASAATLPDDAVREILARVADAAALFRCAMTCRRWRALIADPSFLRRRWPADSPGSSSLFGFFAPQSFDPHRYEHRQPVFVPAPGSPLSAAGRYYLISFFPEGNAYIDFDKAVPLISHRGLLLLHLPNPPGDGTIHLAVCDPLARTSHRLPPLKCGTCFDIARCCAILTSADLVSSKARHCMSSSTFFFKVLILRAQHSINGSRYDLQMFSSNESSWTTPAEKCINLDEAKDLGVPVNTVVRRGGTVRWLFRSTASYHIIQASGDAGHDLSLTKLSIQPDSFKVAAWLTIDAHGNPSLLRVRQDGHQVEWWTCQDQNSNAAEWMCTRIVKLGKPKRKSMCSICLSERSRTLLFFFNSHLHVAHLEAGRLQDVTKLFSGLVDTLSVPFEVDWATFFLSRLGGRD